MTWKRVFQFAKLLLSFGFWAYMISLWIADFVAFTKANPESGLWDFVVDGASNNITVILIGVSLLVLMLWLGSQPVPDADNTEFHERGSH